MLTDRRLVDKIWDDLHENGWTRCESSNSIGFKKDGFLLVFSVSEIPIDLDEFHYENYEINRIKNGINVNKANTNFYAMIELADDDEMSWHLEYLGLMIDAGNLPKSLTKVAIGNPTERQESQYREFIERIENIADGGLISVLGSHFNFYYESVNKKTHKLKRVTPGVIDRSIMRFGDKLFSIIVDDATIQLVPIEIVSKSDDLSIRIVGNGVKTSKESFKHILNTNETSIEMYEIMEDFKQIKRRRWDTSTPDTASMVNSSENYNNLKLNGDQRRIIGYFSSECLNPTHILCNKLDLLTMIYVYLFQKNGLDTDNIKHSYNKEQLQTLLMIAKQGYNIKNYANPKYSSERMYTLFDQFQMSMATKEKEWKDSGLDNDRITALKRIASKGKGIKDTLGKESAAMMYLTDYGTIAGLENTMKYLETCASIDSPVIMVKFDNLPRSIKSELHNYYKNVPKFMVGDKTWDEIVTQILGSADSIVFDYNYGILFGYSRMTRFLGITKNSIYVKDQFYHNIFMSVMLNGSIIVNQRSGTIII